MIQSLWTAGSGLLAQQARVDAISNNIANINTTGFKRDQATFSDLVYARLRPADQQTYLGPTVPAGFDRGHGVRVDAVRKQFGQGMLEMTGRDLDLAIQGDGFFQVRLSDGSTAYTRAGEFRVDAGGTVVTPAGLPLLADGKPLTVPPGATAITVAADGTVTATGADGQPVKLGQIRLTRFADPSALGGAGDGVFIANADAGQPQQVASGDGTAIVQGALERANVDLAQEMVSLVLAQRAYELSARAVQTADQMLALANGLRR